MRAFWIGLAIATLTYSAGAPAATLGDAKIGFSAERILAINGKTYHGRMWTMPGKERHEQDINGIPAAFILRILADSSNHPPDDG